MSRVRFMSPYLKGGRDSSKLVNRARYIATRPGVEILRGEQQDQPATKKQQAYIQRLLRDFPGVEELLEYEDYRGAPTQKNADTFIRQVLEDFAEPMSRMENYLDYVSHRPGVQAEGEHGLWCADGKVRDLSRAVREVAEHTSSVWTPVVAIRREDAERLGYAIRISIAGAGECLRPGDRQGVQDPAGAPAVVRCLPSKGAKRPHPHGGVLLRSREGYLSRRGIQQVKSAFGRRIFQQDLLHVYEQKTEYRNTLGRDAEQAMAELIAQMEHGRLHNERLERLVTELADRLQNTTGKKVYGYLPPGTKAVVDAIVDELAEEERVAAAYDLWNQMREEVCRTYTEHPPQRVPLSRQKEFKAVRNMVIREMLRLGQGEADSPEADGPVSARRVPLSKWSAELPKVQVTQSNAASLQREQTQRAVSRADAARCVLQLFHHMGRIFREQSSADTVQAGLHIDRKRRRQLLKKRLALGHKADDHEDLQMK